MGDRIIKREYIHKTVELTAKNGEIILSGKEISIRGKMRTEMEFSERLTGKKKKAIEIFIKELRKKFKTEKSNLRAGGILFDHCPRCGGIVTLQGRGILQKACSLCKEPYYEPVFK